MNEPYLHLNCPHCQATNRVPGARLTQQPRCGSCKQPLFSGEPLALNATNIEATLTRNDIPILVDCWAPWCEPCRSFAPIFEQAARELEPRLRLAKLDTEAEPELAARWQIRSIPTLILYRGGREQQRVSGAMPLPELKRWLAAAGVN